MTNIKITDLKYSERGVTIAWESGTQEGELSLYKKDDVICIDNEGFKPEVVKQIMGALVDHSIFKE